MSYYFVPLLDSEGKAVVRRPKKGEWFLEDDCLILWDFDGGNELMDPVPIYVRREFVELERREQEVARLVAVCQRVVDGGMSYPKHDRDLAAEALAPFTKQAPRSVCAMPGASNAGPTPLNAAACESQAPETQEPA